MFKGRQLCPPANINIPKKKKLATRATISKRVISLKVNIL